jgi:hypothetical protein
MIWLTEQNLMQKLIGRTSHYVLFVKSTKSKMGRLRDIGEQKTIVDYRDTQIPFLDKQFKQRERHYKKLRAQIKHAWQYQ